MSIQELQKQIQNAVFLTAKQKAALLTAIPGLSEDNLKKLEIFLTQTSQKLGSLVVQQDQKRSTLLKQLVSNLKTTEHQATNNVWHDIENMDHSKEESKLDDLLNEL